MLWRTVFVVLVLSGNTIAQSSDVNQCVFEYQWAFNSLKQTPCLVAAQLESICSGPVGVNAIPVGNRYLGPTFAAATPCICSTVTYSLISACAGCQNRTFTTWTNWIVNCPFTEIVIFPQPIPPNVDVPSWAYLNVSLTDVFDPVAAQANITHTLPTPTTAQPSTSSASSSIAQSSQTSTSNHSNAGAIAGGVVGGIIFLAAVALGALWFVLRRRRGWKNRAIDRRLVNLDEDEPHVPPPPTEGYTIDRTVTTPISSDRTPYVHSRETSDVGSMVTSAVYTTFGGRRSADSLPHNPSQAPRGYYGAPEI